ncbi:MAG TPA: ABC transporter substrate-binding protein, partial [Dehalococcoidia bacterium]|nr:ABC transporter substrate-binding protein [Dehalococcoidia bacterium]
IDTVRNDPQLKLVPTQASTFWLEFPGHEKPESPFNKKQVREAVSLAIDRQALSDAESAGYSQPANNWIPNDWPGAIKGPDPKYDPARAKQLLAEAGYPDGFDVEQLTPLPPYNSLAERVIGQLREVGIRTKLNVMERAAFATKLTEGREAIPGMILNISGLPGDAASRIRTFATCNGPSTRICYPDDIDKKMQAYDASVNPQERERLITEMQQFINDNHLFVPVYRLAFFIAVGPRVLNEPTEVIANIPQYIYLGPYEDFMVKD